MTDLSETLRRHAGVSLYDDCGGAYGPRIKTFARRQLAGRTHFASDDALRFFHSRIVKARTTHDGAFFWLIECSALDMNNTRRGYRWALFDIFGTCISRPDMRDARSSKAAAEKDFWRFFIEIDETAYYRDALAQRAARLMREAAALEIAVSELKADA